MAERLVGIGIYPGCHASIVCVVTVARDARGPLELNRGGTVTLVVADRQVQPSLFVSSGIL